jgi:hypothetical protein
MLPSVLPTETDHVPVLADEVVANLDPRPGETVVDATFGAGGHAGLLAQRLRGDGRVIAIDRDPTVAPFFERFRREHGVKARLHHGEFSSVLQHLASNGVQADAALLVELGLRGTGEEEALHPAALLAQRVERGEARLDEPVPVGAGVGEEAAVHAAGHDDPVAEPMPEAGRQREPVLVVEGVVEFAEEHRGVGPVSST